MSSIFGYNDAAWAVRNSATMVFAAAMLRVVDANKNAATSDLNTRNAITATELFRNYPPLLRFLLSVMKEGVSDMQTMSESGKSGLTASSRLLHPPLFPVLLLLSRVQPVTVSGEDAANLTEPFIPIVFRCLRHRHHKVRTMAARALANLSSDDIHRNSCTKALLKKCETMLSAVPAHVSGLAGRVVKNDWNAKHGALLGIQHLLLKTSDPGTVIQDDQFRAKLYRCVEFESNRFSYPPPCVSVVLETLSDAAARSDAKMDISSDVARMSSDVVSHLNEKFHSSSLVDCIGEARLGAVAARVFCQCSIVNVWDPTKESKEREIALNALSILLENDLIDARLEAAKTFKKPLCDKVDELLVRRDVTKNDKVSVLLQISETLQRALLSELNRSETHKENRDTLGTHPPTVRRLSRCLIECCQALRSLNHALGTNTNTCGGISARNRMWEAATRMASFDQTSFDWENQLSGNAVELMAFVIQALLTFESAPEDESFSLKLQVFVSSLIRCNDEHASWTLRHSMAVAIDTSQILLVSSNGHEWAQLDLFIELLGLLQDNDPDVRFVSGRAVMRASTLENASDVSAYQSATSQLTLEKAYEVVSHRFSQGALNTRLLASLVESCRNLDESLQFFKDEMVQSKQLGSETALMNLGTDRKIFEDEVANSFEEMLLANQLRTASLAKSELHVGPPDEIQQELLGQCRKFLRLLCARELAFHDSNHAPDIAHELTRSSSLFPIIHSVLIGSIVAIYLGSENYHGVKQEAQDIMALLDAEQETAFHPHIVQALRVLVLACPNDDNTRKALLKCCFLVPGLASGARI